MTARAPTEHVSGYHMVLVAGVARLWTGDVRFTCKQVHRSVKIEAVEQ
jgi:hypothetical protein